MQGRWYVCSAEEVVDGDVEVVGDFANCFKTCIVSVLTSVIVLDVVITPTWATFADYILKLCTVMLNGFTGYKFGYENIIYDTVNYMQDQIDLMHRFEQYITDNPTPI